MKDSIELKAPQPSAILDLVYEQARRNGDVCPITIHGTWSFGGPTESVEWVIFKNSDESQDRAWLWRRNRIGNPAAYSDYVEVYDPHGTGIRAWWLDETAPDTWRVAVASDGNWRTNYGRVPYLQALSHGDHGNYTRYWRADNFIIRSEVKIPSDKE